MPEWTPTPEQQAEIRKRTKQMLKRALQKTIKEDPDNHEAIEALKKLENEPLDETK